LRNPQTGLFVDVTTFSTDEFVIKSIFIPRKIDTTFAQILQRRVRVDGKEVRTPSDAELKEFEPLAQKKEFDLFDDLVSKGHTELWLRCGESQQYIGVAQADLYLRATDANVPFNFVKGFFGIWQQMLLVIAFGVLFSTFLSGPVTMVATLGIMITGFFKQMLLNIGLLEFLGGGPVEALVRIISHQNLVQDLQNNFATAFIKAIDRIYGAFIALFGQAIPPLSDYSLYYDALANGFNISPNWMIQNGLMTFSYLLPLYIVAYIILSNREIAK
ncbi:MAG: hypothetical protein ACRC2T_12920, partial [Thermoguttaceae bacterium]